MTISTLSMTIPAIPDDEHAPLASLNILITRPLHQAKNLSDLLKTAGANPILFPTIEIIPIPDTHQFEQIIQDLIFCDILIFTSANAVRLSLNFLNHYWPQLPPTLSIAAIGKASSHALVQAGIHVDFCPTGQTNSEALLELTVFKNIKGKNIVIMTGENGRDYLPNQLKERGASVTLASCYRRVIPTISNQEILSLLNQRAINAIVCSSNQGLTNLLTMLDHHRQELIDLIKDIPIVGVSKRMLQLANELGFRNKIIISDIVSDAAILKALLAWKEQSSESRKSANV